MGLGEGQNGFKSRGYNGVKMNSQPPKLKVCKNCPYNIGSDTNGLCATCDPNHRWWKNECVEEVKTVTAEHVHEQ